jgi:hypothetical protein
MSLISAVAASIATIGGGFLALAIVIAIGFMFEFIDEPQYGVWAGRFAVIGVIICSFALCAHWFSMVQ